MHCPTLHIYQVTGQRTQEIKNRIKSSLLMFMEFDCHKPSISVLTIWYTKYSTWCTQYINPNVTFILWKTSHNNYKYIIPGNLQKKSGSINFFSLLQVFVITQVSNLCSLNFFCFGAVSICQMHSICLPVFVVLFISFTLNTNKGR